jgi:agmatine/peptidylarginine deiminase
MYKNYSHPVFFTDDINPPTSPVRTMAEWEEFQAIMITWTSYQQILSQIVRYAQDECRIIIVCSDSNSVKSQLTGYGVPLVNLSFIIAPFNSVWCRDYGPWTIYTNQVDSLRLIDWVYNRPRPLDDVIPGIIANYMNLTLHQMTNAPNDLIATGGNFMCDGNGTGFSSKLILNENPTKTEAQIDTMMRKYMGLKSYIFMNTLPYDGIHHIDMHMKLLDEETIMVGQYPSGVSDGPGIEANLQYILANYQTCYGKPYKVVRIPMPPSSTGQYPPNSSYFTYTNSLIVNKTVLVPIYNFSLDTTALRIYRDAMPGYRVVGFDCNASIPSSGAIHCITKEIGVSEPVFISHSGLRNTSNTTSAYPVKAYIKTKSGVSSAKLFWTTDTTAGFQQLSMTAIADTFSASIPPQQLNTKIYYYLSATSNSSRTVKKPLTAPSGNFRFMITNQTFITGNENIPEEYELKQNYPNPFNPSTTIKYSLGNSDFVNIFIYDILGRKTINLINENQTSGNHEIKFDGTNLASGIYFYTMKSGIYKETKIMMLIK